MRIRCIIEGGQPADLTAAADHHVLDGGEDKFRLLLGGLRGGGTVHVIRAEHEDGRVAVKIMPVTGHVNRQGVFDFNAWFRLPQAPKQ